MELSSSNIKKLFIFSQKEAFLIFQKVTIRARKMKKPTLKRCLTFREMKVSNPKPKNFNFFVCCERTFQI